MPAFVKVNFTKPLTIKKGNNNDLATRFQISNTSSTPPNPSLVILSAQIQGSSVLLELQNDEVPKPGHLMTIAYTKPNNEVGALVDASTGYDVENLVSVSSTTLNNAIANTPLPEVIQGVVEHETPNKIQISFTQGGRTMQQILFQTMEQLVLDLHQALLILAGHLLLLLGIMQILVQIFQEA